MGTIDRIAALREDGEQIDWDFGKLPVQLEFLNSPAKFTVFSGGFACGKTTVLVAKLISLLLGVPGNMGYLGRLDGKALRATTLQTLYEMLPEQYYTKNEQQGFLKIKPQYGGSKLLFGDFKDMYDLKNMPLGFYAIDQMEEVPWNVWEYLTGRLRRKVPLLTDDGFRQYRVIGECPRIQSDDKRHMATHGATQCRYCSSKLPKFDDTLPKKNIKDPDADRTRPWDLVCYPTYGFGVCNPEGPSHWIFQSFPGLPGHGGITSGPGLKNYAGWHADAYDGLAAGFTREDYVADMEIAYANNPLMAERYLHGLWVEAEGMVYPGWDTPSHTLPMRATKYNGEPLIKEEWPIIEYIDHGLTKPTAVGWVALEEECDCGCGRMNWYLIDEHYEGGKVVSYHSAIMKQKRTSLPGSVAITYLDSQAFSKTLMGQKGTPREDQLYSVADEYVENGIFVVPNQKDWDAGYNRISEVLQIDPKHRHPLTGEMGAPHFFVFVNCPRFIGEVDGYRWKRVRAGATFKEEPQDDHDHHMDGLNGMLTSRPGGRPSVVGGIDLRKENPTWLEELERETMGRVSHMAL